MNKSTRKSKLHKLSNALLRIVTNRIFVGLVLNIIYHFGIGAYFSWCAEGSAADWVWWIKLLIFAVLINAHRDIYKIITRYGW